MTKMARTFRHPLTARLALEVAIYGTHPRVHEPTLLWFMSTFLPQFGVLNLGDRMCFLFYVSTKAKRLGGTTSN